MQNYEISSWPHGDDKHDDGDNGESSELLSNKKSTTWKYQQAFIIVDEH